MNLAHVLGTFEWNLLNGVSHVICLLNFKIERIDFFLWTTFYTHKPFIQTCTKNVICKAEEKRRCRRNMGKKKK